VILLARFILRGYSQAALVAATTALLGLLFPPAAWLSAAAIALVTLVKGGQNGLLTTVISMIGAAVFTSLIFEYPLIMLVFVAIVWLPAWMTAMVLRKTVSLALSLQALTAVSIIAVVAVYLLYPHAGEMWRQTFDELFKQLSQQSSDVDMASLKRSEDWLLAYLPGLFVSGLMFTTTLSLLLARWWQAVIYNPGGFAGEFQRLNLGRVSATIALLCLLATMLTDSVMVSSIMTVVLMLYIVQGLSLIHAVVNIRKVSGIVLVIFYMAMFFIPQLALALFVAALADPWFDLRRRLEPKAQ
jgi:hypothetical protein